MDTSANEKIATGGLRAIRPNNGSTSQFFETIASVKQDIMVSTCVNEGVDSASHDDGGAPSQTSGA